MNVFLKDIIYNVDVKLDLTHIDHFRTEGCLHLFAVPVNPTTKELKQYDVQIGTRYLIEQLTNKNIQYEVSYLHIPTQTIFQEIPESLCQFDFETLILLENSELYTVKIKDFYDFI
jgi:hypothetical protein